MPAFNPPTPPHQFIANIATAFLVGGLGSLVGLVALAPDHWYCVWWFDVLLFMATGCLLVGLYLFANVFFGKPPLIGTHQQRLQKKRWDEERRQQQQP